MSFNKPKAKRNAERYLTQGKIQAAIHEYRQIVDHDPKDVNTQNMLGDLYVKADNPEEAVTCYQSVADYYNGQGFAKKAIAIYNKIFRITPDSMEVSSRLAELYRVRGQYAEAKNHYETLAAHYESKGQRIEALAIWENIAELDPRNAEVYLKIAESYWQDDRHDEATEAFVKAGQRLAATNNHESAVTAFSRALEITPLDLEAIEGLVRSQIDLGYPEEAAKTLEKRIENEPFDKQTNFLLVDCYYDMDEPESAESVIVKMVERDPSNYRKFLDLINVYFKKDDLESAVRVLSMISEHMLVGGEHEGLLELLEEVLARNPEHLSALRLLTRYHGWLKDETEMKAALERVVESARINESEEDERFALSQLALIVPHDRGISTRLAELGGSPFDAENESALATRNSADVPDFKSYAVLSDDSDTAENAVGGSGETETSEATEVKEAGSEFEGMESGEYRVLEEEQHLDAVVVSESDQDVGDQSPNGTQDESGAGLEPESERPADQQEVIEKPDEALDVLSAADEMRLDEELESIKFYLDQGYNGLADKSITELEREFGYRPEIVEMRMALEGGSPSASERNKKAADSESPANGSDAGSKIADESAQNEEHEPQKTEAVSEQPAIDRDVEEKRPGAAQPAAEAEAEPSADTSANSAEPESENEVFDADPGGESAESDEQTNDSFDSILDGAAFNEAHENKDGGESAESKESKDFTDPFENLRDELGLGESEGEEDDDFENHYHHAVAYQEMGLLEEAIREFQNAVNTVSPNDGRRRYLNCCSLLGHCFMEKGMPNLAVVWFERAFETTDMSEDERSGLHYELANAYEESGEIDKAISEFEAVYAVDVDYRDVNHRLEKIRNLTPANA
ncbi:MAG: tetratricopeptide repeat protein [Acidobacteriota bacterium]|nr:tetratricopeptide repeat protein [Acidobacteriota bacterium]